MKCILLSFASVLYNGDSKVVVYSYLDQNTNGVKKQRPRTKKGKDEKDVVSNWVAKAYCC